MHGTVRGPNYSGANGISTAYDLTSGASQRRGGWQLARQSRHHDGLPADDACGLRGGVSEVAAKRRAQDSNLYGLAPSGFQDRRLTS